MPSPNAYYGTLDAANAYHEARGNSAWFDLPESPDPDEVHEQMLLRGSEYVDRTFRARFPGKKTEGRDQVREWPRTGAVDQQGYSIPADEVPLEIEQASYEAALQELLNPGTLNPVIIPGEKVIREKVADLEVEYSDRGPTDGSGMLPWVSILEGMLSGLLTGPRNASTSVSQFGRF